MKFRNAVVVVLMICISTLVVWQAIAQLSDDSLRSTGDARGLREQVEALDTRLTALEGEVSELQEANTALQAKVNLHNTGQVALFDLRRVEKVCDRIEANGETAAWGVYLYDESNQTDGYRFVTRDPYVTLITEDITEYENHLRNLRE
jgi:hypothetical protein